MKSMSRRMKTIIGLVVFTIAAVLLKLNFSGTDDWVYSYNPAVDNLGRTEILLLSVSGSVVLTWFVISILYIVKGKAIVNDSGIKRMNPKRKMGIVLLTVPFIWGLITTFSILLEEISVMTLSITILNLVLIIWGIIYCLKNKLRLAFAPILLTAFVTFVLYNEGGLGLGSAKMETTNSAASGALYSSKSMMQSAMPSFDSAAMGESIGFSVGGAKDISNFRKNIENNYLPQYSSITYEGLFYDYYFDTGKKQEAKKLFSPSYTYAVSKDPFSKQEEYYLSVGLNSGMKQEDFKRKKLNLALVLDISGSMSSGFDRYYYDRFKGSSTETAEKYEDSGKSKMEIAAKSIVSLLDHLNIDDRFGMVLFDNSGYLAKPMSNVGETDLEAIKGHILELQPRGGTNFEAGYKEASKLFEEFEKSNPQEYENRIIFITDAMPNIGAISESSLLGMTKSNSEKRIYTTFIGVGVDFNTELIEYITKIKGANYYSVHSAKEFKTRMDDEFEYMVTPLVFNLQLKLDAKGYKIEKVYGSPEADEATGEIMKVNTLFPSKQSNNETRGGIVLLKLKKLSSDAQLSLSTSYEDRNGKADKDTVLINFEDKSADYYENKGIRKGILLARYANLMKNWIYDQLQSNLNSQADVKASISVETGIIVPDTEKHIPLLNKWEHQSVPLQVSNQYKQLFGEFIPYFESEMKAVEDESLAKELDILKKLCK